MENGQEYPAHVPINYIIIAKSILISLLESLGLILNEVENVAVFVFHQVNHSFKDIR